MATASTATTVSLKLLIDTKGKRVLYAEAGKDFVDFLFNVQLLPVGTIKRLLAKEGMVGCLANLYKSIENLGDTYLQLTTNKDTLLKPKYSSSLAADVPLLLPNTKSSTTLVFNRCSYGHNSDCLLYYANDPTSKCPCCSSVMYSPATLVNPPNKVSTSSAVANEVTALSTISSIAMLNKFKVQQVDALEEKVVDVGIKEGVEILKASLQSKTVLTSVFLTQKAWKTGSK
ncbi:hypothetical protein E1A91_A10G234200v1 [Gossypium mustelinum]|uniref:DUF674 domain-containing protein n=1 Tax=Gossypium mustelinum TaxID=34275 RepID=A0A5D2XQQ5_GOSMU|nr:hypothetical protein E1A91_A10G234200v1 [Gossypium mustelinum]